MLHVPTLGFEQTDWIALRDARSGDKLVQIHGNVWALPVAGADCANGNQKGSVHYAFEMGR